MHPSDDALLFRARQRLKHSLCERYRLSRLLAMGGMAEAVYAGVHRNGHAVVVEGSPHDRLAGDPQIELSLPARGAGSRTRSGIPESFQSSTMTRLLTGVFLVMPLLRGETLRARAERSDGRRLPVTEVLLVAHAVLEVLEAAHAKQVVHRDIKPENVFLTTAGR